MKSRSTSIFLVSALATLITTNALAVSASQPISDKSYTVETGDSLWAIASRPHFYADSFSWPVIFQANLNQIKNPHLIYPGQELILPFSVSPAYLRALRAWASHFPQGPLPQVSQVPLGLDLAEKNTSQPSAETSALPGFDWKFPVFLILLAGLALSRWHNRPRPQIRPWKEELLVAEDFAPPQDHPVPDPHPLPIPRHEPEPRLEPRPPPLVSATALFQKTPGEKSLGVFYGNIGPQSFQ